MVSISTGIPEGTPSDAPSPRRPLVIAHRGASGYRPEHTRAAYELALMMGADALEPDIVLSRDGVLVLRHENELSGTTDIEARPEFAKRRTTKIVDGHSRTGWFSEDFTWAELSTLTARERMPTIRPASAEFDGTENILRLSDLLEIIDRFAAEQSRPIVLVAELKHAHYFASIGLPLDELFATAVDGWATASNLIVESFELTVLAKLRARGLPGRLIFLVENSGAPADSLALDDGDVVSYADHLTAAGLAKLAHTVDGVSVSRRLILEQDAAGNATGITAVVARAQAAGLLVFTWTLRAENRFLCLNHRSGTDPTALGDWRTEFALVMSSGVDGVFADQPDLVIKARRLSVPLA
jgi:glycerophosphoryl diester phosphodiesterase